MKAQKRLLQTSLQTEAENQLIVRINSLFV